MIWIVVEAESIADSAKSGQRTTVPFKNTLTGSIDKVETRGIP